MSAIRLKVMTYNVHHGAGRNEPHADLERIVSVIQAEQPDIVALQEVDRFWNRSGGVDQPQEYARLLGMNVAYGANLVLEPGAHADVPHEYGVATLTRHEILRNLNTLLPTTEGWEQRGLLDSRINVPGIGEVAVLNTHLQYLSYADPAECSFERKKQAEVIAAHLETIDVPVLLMGDFNAEVGSEDIAVLTGYGSALVDVWGAAGHGSGLTAPVGPDVDPDVRIDLILVSAALRVDSVTVVANATTRAASDHYPVVAELKRISQQDSDGATAKLSG